MSDITLREAQEVVDNWIQEYGEGYWPPMVKLARLVEEVGEFSRELNHEYGVKTKKVEDGGDKIEEELGDILFTIICIANSRDIELDKTLKKVLNKYDDRDRDRWIE
ncbi:MAG: nucleotide pyrophosphohydrolase [Candidatus Aenigmatarchaeota archaeon]